RPRLRTRTAPLRSRRSCPPGRPWRGTLAPVTPRLAPKTHQRCKKHWTASHRMQMIAFGYLAPGANPVCLRVLCEVPNFHSRREFPVAAPAVIHTRLVAMYAESSGTASLHVSNLGRQAERRWA